MFTGHASRLFSGPPGPNLQRINALLHHEPYSFLAYGAYWSLVLLVGAPLSGALLIWITLYKFFRYYVMNTVPIEPRMQPEKELAVVVTGCDTGFGKELVFRLVAEGFVVFACCLKDDSKDHYRIEPLVKPITLDVTDDERVQEACEQVKQWLDDPASNKRRIMHALVNNAGVGKIGYVDWINVSDYKFCMEGSYVLAM